MTVTQASLNALAAHTRKRSDTVRARIEKALRELRKQNADITVSSVARRAGVTRKSIYQRHDLVALIRAHRPVATVPDDKPPPPDTETSIVAALRARLTAKDTQIAQLKKKQPCATATAQSPPCTAHSNEPAPQIDNRAQPPRSTQPIGCGCTDDGLV